MGWSWVFLDYDLSIYLCFFFIIYFNFNRRPEVEQPQSSSADLQKAEDLALC